MSGTRLRVNQNLHQIGFGSDGLIELHIGTATPFFLALLFCCRVPLLGQRTFWLRNVMAFALFFQNQSGLSHWQSLFGITPPFFFMNSTFAAFISWCAH